MYRIFHQFQLRQKECVISIIEIIKKPEIYCKQFSSLPVSSISWIYFCQISFPVISNNLFPTKTNQVGKILIAITVGGVSDILLTYLVAFISGYKEVIAYINFVNNIINKMLSVSQPSEALTCTFKNIFII